MGDVVNLNQVRKAREKLTRERQATVNRARFGRDKTERQRSVDDQNKLKKDLDGKALSPTVEEDREPKP